MSICACMSVFWLRLTTIILIERVHTWKVDGQSLKGRRQADPALRPLHVEAGRRARVGRLGQARLGIFHAKYGSRRLERLRPAPHGRSTTPRKRRVKQEPGDLHTDWCRKSLTAVCSTSAGDTKASMFFFSGSNKTLDAP